MNSITVRNTTITIPSEWNELTASNMLWLAKRFPYPPTNGFSFEFFVHLINLKKNIRFSWALFRNSLLSLKLDRQWKDETLIELGESNFFLQQINQTISALDDFRWVHEFGAMEKCLIRKIRIGFRSYYGPGDMLANVVGDEFSHADDFLSLFLETKEDKYLHYMIACLWREKAANKMPHDNRIPFSEFEVTKRAEKIAKLNSKFKYACLINYMGLRSWFITRETSRIVFSKSENQSSGNSNWGTILLRIAENKTFGIHSEVKKTFIHDIVDHLADKIKQDKK